MKFEPDKMESQDIYKVLSGVVVPRPIAFVSTYGSDGVPNVAPFSFFQAITPSPPHVSFSVGLRGAEKKDTLANLEAHGECAINIVNSEIARRMAMSAIDLPANVSEFEASGLSLGECDVVRAPRVLESPATLECQVRHMMPIGDERYGATLIICQVVRFHVRDDLVLENNRIDFKRLDAVGRLAGDWYCTTEHQYTLPRSQYERELVDYLR